MAAQSKTGLLDLEKELSCSICTEILYQPLTLLDCLHTFCGSCLKEWFASQASRASSTTTSPYTCPSCRASVRETRPDAKVTTLLEMFVQANPTMAKTPEEKEEMQKRYKPGENVLPKLESNGEEEDSDEEDRRMIEEVREMSLRDIGSRGPRSYARGARHRNRSHDPREEETTHRRRRDEGRRDRSEGWQATRTTGSRGNDVQENSESRSQARQIEHQSSLRSLISTSDVDSSEMEEEILRQIEEDGLLEGIDLNNIDVSQENALSERIAEAYRRRHGQRPRSQDTRTEETGSSRSRTMPTTEEQSSRRHHARRSSGTHHTMHSSHPPLTRSHLLEAYPAGHSHRHRTSSDSGRQMSPSRISPQSQRQAARSATDLSSRPQAAQNRQRRPSDLSSHGRRTTDPHPGRLSDNIRRYEDDLAQVTSRRHEPPITYPHNTSLPQQISPPSSASGRTVDNSRRRPPSPVTIPPAEMPRPLFSSPTFHTQQHKLFQEPSIDCERCGKQNIQYELHTNCSICKNGDYSLCYRCYRSGLGCLHWHGFGSLARQRFQHDGISQSEPPHYLAGHKYLRPKPESISVPTGDERKKMTTEDPVERLQSGAFCSNCSTFADDCYWKCDYCNEGTWGCCNKCVNQGRCCTHPLLPVAHTSSMKSKDHAHRSKQHAEASFAPITSPRMLQGFSSLDLAASGQYRPLTFSTNCDICKYPVQPSQTRFHCYQCNDGDYDICATCYSRLISKSLISRENGEKGWRRCLQGHRMVLVGFEDSTAGQRRIVVKDLVGGHALKDETAKSSEASPEWSWPEGQGKQTRTMSKPVTGNHEVGSASVVPLLQRYPPDGGVGMRVVAIWSYWPQDGVRDELMFPKGAEIREVEDINGDWFWGCYGGAKGLFPGNYVRVLDVVTM